MNFFTKTFMVTAIAIAVFTVSGISFDKPLDTDGVFNNIAFAVGPGGGDGGCCGGEGDGGYDNDGGGYESFCTDPAALNTDQPLPCKSPQPPVCNFLKANGQTGTVVLPYGVNTVDLTWSTTNADTVVFNPSNVTVADNNSTGRTETVTHDTTFEINVTNAAGSDSCQVVVDVPEDRVLTCNDVVFDSTPSSPVYPGTSVNLSWVFTGEVTSATIDNGIGDAFIRDNVDVVINNETTFNATIANATTNISCPYTVTVEPVTNAPRCVLFEADPDLHPYGGGQSTLTWEAINADSITIDNGVLASTNVLFGTASVTVTDSITYTMTVSAAGHTDVTCPAPIAVADPGVFSCENNVVFTASDTSLPRGGGNVNFNWDVTNADSVSISGLSSTAHSGSESVEVDNDQTFVLTATKSGYTTISCPISVDVASGGGGGSSNPRCDLDISDEHITLGDEITLKWDTSNARDVKITDNHGNVLLESDDRDDFDGKMTIKPTEDTEYTLLVERGSKDRECEVEVEVKNNVTVLQTRTHDPRVAGISLTQVPYTGFEAGPTLTFIFYALLTIWGLFVAYVFVIRRDSLAGVSFAGAHDHATYTDLSTAEAVDDVEAETEAESYVHAVAHTESPVNLPTAPVVGYSALVAEATDEEADASIEMTELENRAHAQNVLLSSDAMRFFINATEAGETRNEKLDVVIAQAKASFPSEGGWVTLNLARIETLISDKEASEEVETETEVINGGSLAEAIIDGNVVAAYELIAHRPMIALADAAAELDSAYRSRKGEAIEVSDMLANATVTTTQLEEAITALTGALDGTYANEAAAVKMAILKAVQATS